MELFAARSMMPIWSSSGASPRHKARRLRFPACQTCSRSSIESAPPTWRAAMMARIFGSIVGRSRRVNAAFGLSAAWITARPHDRSAGRRRTNPRDHAMTGLGVETYQSSKRASIGRHSTEGNLSEYLSRRRPRESEDPYAVADRDARHMVPAFARTTPGEAGYSTASEPAAARASGRRRCPSK